jgi:2,3-diketo-5-methylthio-1-phosphopentane phosphatase
VSTPRPPGGAEPAAFPRPGPAGVALVLDFDGTIALRDIGDEVMDRFGPPGWRALDRELAAGRISLLEMQRRLWPAVRGEREAILAWVDERAELRAGLETLLRQGFAGGARVVVASGGFDFYIRRVLARLGSLGERIEVVANGGVLRGGAVEVNFAHAAASCGRCSVCKGAALAAIAAGGRRTVFCGDGGSDCCAIGRADRLFAVAGSRLAHRCAELGAAHTTFESFEEVLPALEAG